MSTTLRTDPRKYLHTTLYARRKEYLTPTRIRIKVSTWNVASLTVERDIREWIRECEGSKIKAQDSDRKLRGKVTSTIGELLDGAKDKLKNLEIDTHFDEDDEGGEGEVDLYVIALQEIVDVTAAESYLRATDPKIPLNWKAHAQAALPEGYKLIASPQLVGLLMLVYASPRLQHMISSVSSTTVGTGLMGYVGNKGATGVRIILGETTRLVLVNCHLAAFQNGAERRNWDHAEIVRRMNFDAVKRDVLAGMPVNGDFSLPQTEEREGLDKADLIIWAGDLNYRVDRPNDEIRKILEPFMPYEFPPTIPSDAPASPASYASPRSATFPTIHTPGSFQEKSPDEQDTAIRSLLQYDQLYKMQTEGRSFIGYKEGKITFLPTYKYDVGTSGIFDTSEKQRAPSYCDRILWKMREEDETNGQDIKPKEPPKKGDVQEVVFESIDTSEATAAEAADKLAPPTRPNRPRATTLTVEDEDGEDLIVSRSINVIPHAPPPPEDEEDSPPIPPASFPQNASYSSAKETELNLELVTYTSHQAINSSDHKPVTAVFSLTFPSVNDDLKSEVYAEVAKEVDRLENERRPVVTVIIDREGETVNPVQSEYRDENMNVFLGEVRLGDAIEKKVTIANTGLVPAKILFRERPVIDDEFGEVREAICKPWLDVDFEDLKSDGGKAITQGVTLEPGEVVEVYLNVCIELGNVPLLQKLNDGTEKLDDILVLHVENGRDQFIPVSGLWLQSCFGRSLQELVMIPEGTGGARAFFAPSDKNNGEEKKHEMRYSAPRELYRITEFLLHKIKDIIDEDVAKDGGVESQKWYADVGWPFVKDTWGLQYDEDITSDVDDQTPGKRRKLLLLILENLSKDEEFGFTVWTDDHGYTTEDVVEVMAECLLGFLGALKGRVVPEVLYDTVMKAGAGGSREAETVLESLPTMASPIHANVFIYLTGFISEVLSLLSSTHPDMPVPGLTRVSTTDSITSAKSKRSSVIKTTARKQLLQQKIAGAFAEVMVYKPPPAPAVTKGKGNRMSAASTASSVMEKRGDEDRRRAFVVHFLQV